MLMQMKWRKQRQINTTLQKKLTQNASIAAIHSLWLKCSNHKQSRNSQAGKLASAPRATLHRNLTALQGNGVSQPKESYKDRQSSGITATIRDLRKTHRSVEGSETNLWHKGAVACHRGVVTSNLAPEEDGHSGCDILWEFVWHPCDESPVHAIWLADGICV